MQPAANPLVEAPARTREAGSVVVRASLDRVCLGIPCGMPAMGRIHHVTLRAFPMALGFIRTVTGLHVTNGHFYHSFFPSEKSLDTLDTLYIATS